jgi:hypothetical protein
LQFKQGLVLIIIIALLIFVDINSSYSENFTAPKNNNNTLQNTSSNTETIANRGVSLNPERLQIILRNDTSKNSDNGQQTFSLLTNIITAGSAIGGGIIGSILTFRHNREIEEQKIRAQQKKEEDFNSRIREIVRFELERFSHLCDDLIGSPREAIERYREAWKTAISFPTEYTKMSLETRATVFSPESLARVEQSYISFKYLSTIFDGEVNRYLNKQITREDFLDNLGIKGDKSLIDEAIELLKKEDKTWPI